MYSLVVLLSILASASFVLAFVRGDRAARAAARAVARAAALHAHVGPVPDRRDGGRVAGAVAARARSQGRDGARLGAALALIYAPWLPTVVFQAAHTAAPWAERPSPLLLLGIPGGLFGHVAVPLLALAVFAALRRRPPVDRAVRVLAAIAIATAGLAWLCSQIQPAWANALPRRPARPAAARARVGRLARRALDGGRAGRRRRRVADERAAADQEQRAHGVDRRRAVDPPRRPRRLDAARAGPGAVPLPAAGRRLPDADGARLRPAPDRLARRPRAPARRPGRARAAAGARAAGPRRAGPDRHPGARRASSSQAPWSRAVRIRTREWRAALQASGRAAADRRASTTLPWRKNTVRAELYEVRLANPHVQVVVVVDQRHDDLARALQVQARADEDLDRARGHEAVDEVLREPRSTCEGLNGRRSVSSVRG